MSFTEINLFGVYVAPAALMMAAAWLMLVAVLRIADRFGLLRHVWHPALFEFGLHYPALVDRPFGRPLGLLMSGVELKASPVAESQSAGRGKAAAARIIPLLITLAAAAAAVCLGWLGWRPIRARHGPATAACAPMW